MVGALLLGYNYEKRESLVSRVYLLYLYLIIDVPVIRNTVYSATVYIIYHSYRTVALLVTLPGGFMLMF